MKEICGKCVWKLSETCRTCDEGEKKMLSYDIVWELPVGWIYAFGDKLVNELNLLIEKHSATEYEVMQLKEKFAKLRLYATGIPDEMLAEHDMLITKYENLSVKTCEMCGKNGFLSKKGGIIYIACEKHMYDALPF